MYPLLYSALIDDPSGALLSLSTNIPSIVFLNEHVDDTRHILGVNHPNYHESFFLALQHPREYTKWKWDPGDRIFVETPEYLQTDALRERASLAHAKGEAIIEIMNHLSHARSKAATGVQFQETIYATKRMQAQSFRDLGYDETKILEIPYVVQYADYANIPLQQAADDILLKASLDDEMLAKTELLRLKYFNEVRAAQTPEDLKRTVSNFMRACHRNALI